MHIFGRQQLYIYYLRTTQFKNPRNEHSIGEC